jgi:uncharacterized protein YndB with AHSA1/START domain
VTQRSVQHGTFVIQREFAQAPARVFAAWAEPKAKAKWFSGPAGKWKELDRRMDFRVGGSERLRGRFDEGRETEFLAHYHDIVPNQRIVYSYSMQVGERRISVSLATIEFHRSGDGTRLVLTEQGAFLDGQHEPATRETGTRALIDALAKSLGN